MSGPTDTTLHDERLQDLFRDGFVAEDLPAVFPLLLGTLFAMTTARTKKSRCFMALCGLAVAVPAIIGLACFLAVGV